MNYTDLSTKILQLLGGKENVALAIHCATRLRFNLKDKSLVDNEQLKNLPGTFGTQWSGDQLQVIVGNEVADVYKELCRVGGFTEEKAIDENLDAPKTDFNLKTVASNVAAFVTACITPVLAVFTVGGFLRLLVTLLGPVTFGILPADNHIIMLLSAVSSACFTYFPVFIAYATAKHCGSNPVIAMLLACFLVSPALADLAAIEGGFKVFGIPMMQATYTSTFLPALISTWVLSKIEKFFMGILPANLKRLFAPFLSVIIMLPVMLCAVGPLGTVIGNVIAAIIVWFQNIFGPVATGLVGALFPLLIVTGMHHPLNNVALVEFTKLGYDTCIWAGSYFMAYQLMGIALATIIVSRKSDTKSIATSAFLTISISGISEPTLFGVMMKSKKAILYTLIGGFAAGFYVGLMKVYCYTFPPEGFTSFLAYSGGSVPNLVHGIIASVIAFVLPFVLGLVFGMGIDEDEKALLKKKAA